VEKQLHSLRKATQKAKLEAKQADFQDLAEQAGQVAGYPELRQAKANLAFQQNRLTQMRENLGSLLQEKVQYTATGSWSAVGR
jgi:phage repressor protein C with HTH and peptisase S24 domain